MYGKAKDTPEARQDQQHLKERDVNNIHNFILFTINYIEFHSYFFMMI
jgi:hypothetical protein